MARKKKVGIALGSGAARGLVHIGVLKELEKRGIKLDDIAGTSMGAVIGALYASGKTPKELEEIAQTTDWKSIVDFTIPKRGLLKGELVEKKLRSLLGGKSFGRLKVPLQVAAYDMTKNEPVVFSRGDVARAVRASSSIPGIFSPVRIKGSSYVDGVLVNPTPFDVVREMGANVVIAVDLYDKASSRKREEGYMRELREKFIVDELLNVRNYLFPKRWPRFLRNTLLWLFDKVMYPARVMKIMAGRELPEIAKVMYNSFGIVADNFAKERMKNADVDIIVAPTFSRLQWSDFDKVDEFVALGEKSMQKEMRKLTKLL